MAASCSAIRFLLIFLFVFVQCSLQQTCYFPDGNVAINDKPCTGLNSGTDTVLPCCPPDRECMPNKMCQGSKTDGNPSRGSCTDQSWGSPDCPQFCQKYLPGGMIFDCTARSGITNADDNRFYCCAGDSSQCCNNQSLLFRSDNWNFASGSLATPISSSAAAASTAESSAAESSAAEPQTKIVQTSSSSSSPTTTTSTSSASSSSSTESSNGSSSTLSTSSSSPSSSPSLSSSSSSSKPPSSSTSSSRASSTLSSSTTKANAAKTTTESNSDASTAPSTSTSTSATSSTTTTAATHPEAKRDWTGVGIGIGVGIAVPLLALAIIVPIFWRRYRRRQVYELDSPPIYPHDSASSRSTSTRKSPLVRVGKPTHLHEADGIASYELDAYGSVVELPMKSPRSPRELPGSEGERQRSYRAYQPHADQ